LPYTTWRVPLVLSIAIAFCTAEEPLDEGRKLFFGVSIPWIVQAYPADGKIMKIDRIRTITVVGAKALF